MKFCWLIGILFLLSITSWSQNDSVKWMVFDPDFKFTDGIYLNFNQVKYNKPLIKSRIISNIDYNSSDFYDILLNKSEFSFYDFLGMKQTVQVKNIWGFAKNGNLYIHMFDSYNKITYVGSICHFVATISISYQPVYDPYYSPYYSGWNNTVTVNKNEIKQYIMDFSTGKILDYETKNLEIILMRDPQIYDEYLGLSKRKRQQLMFYYIRKFNERNPLKIPVYAND